MQELDANGDLFSEVAVLFVPNHEKDYTPDRVYDIPVRGGAFTWRRVGQPIPAGSIEVLRTNVSHAGIQCIEKVLEDAPATVRRLEDTLVALGDKFGPDDSLKAFSSHPYDFHPLGLAYFIVHKLTLQVHGKMQYFGPCWGYTHSGDNTVVL